MFKRLSLFLNTTQTDLMQCMIDKTHEKINFGYANKIFNKLDVEKYQSHLFTALKKNFKSSSDILKIKSLILLHYLIRKSNFRNFVLMQFAQKQLIQLKSKQTFEPKTTKQKKLIEYQQKQYIQKNIIEFYVYYLLKLMAHREAVIEAKQKTANYGEHFQKLLQQSPQHKTLDTTAVTQMQKSLLIIQRNDQESQLMSHINNGFQILNLINYILQSQQCFNKMGRYYIEHDEILNLFLMYLNDMTIYNDYTKRLAKLVINRINHAKQEEIKHCFLYLTESQKLSDRLYEFYYNRYYYNRVKKIITVPKFLTIQNQQFQRISKQIRKVDKQLYLAIRQSKYSDQYKMNRTRCKTQPNLCVTIKSFQSKYKQNNYTIQRQSKDRPYQQITKTLSNLHTHQKSKQQIQENITKYIKSFDNNDYEEFI